MDNKFRCPVYKKCGGCQLDVTYPQQISYKQRTITSLLGKFHKIDPIVGMDEPFHYRCKVSAAFGYSHGRVISGVWQSSSGKLTPVDDCALEDERAGVIIAAIKELLPSFKLRTYDERTGRGFLRFVMIRIGKQSGEILVALGTGGDILPMAKNFAVALAKKCPNITTIVRCVSTD
ncbi:MAG: 23S rRNA (uracil(1939)-C(5))-methyltransferase RlmD, partial [Oscillospiraceae bacterium]|nr:23S rRNA (uracil(1939)-C(5))-methyltransferase RlmD [Oscillospiraceae bacterium]